MALSSAVIEEIFVLCSQFSEANSASSSPFFYCSPGIGSMFTILFHLCIYSAGPVSLDNLTTRVIASSYIGTFLFLLAYVVCVLMKTFLATMSILVFFPVKLSSFIFHLCWCIYCLQCERWCTITFFSVCTVFLCLWRRSSHNTHSVTFDCLLIKWIGYTFRLVDALSVYNVRN